MSRNKKALESLHGLLIEELIGRIQGGEATPSDLNVARQLLRDNQIDCAAIEGAPILKLAENLPFSDDEEEAA
jgi:hypothetical protein